MSSIPAPLQRILEPREQVSLGIQQKLHVSEEEEDGLHLLESLERGCQNIVVAVAKESEQQIVKKSHSRIVENLGISAALRMAAPPARR